MNKIPLAPMIEDENIITSMKNIAKQLRRIPGAVITFKDDKKLIKLANEWDKILIKISEKWSEKSGIIVRYKLSKYERTYGYISHHINGKKVFYTDNKPAHWIFKYIFENRKTPTIEQTISMFSQDHLRFLNSKNKEIKTASPINANLKFNKDFQIKDKYYKKWYVCHIKSMEDVNTPVEKFQRFMSVNNIVLVPLWLRGMAEQKAFVNELVNK